jgi:NAD(P)-dependent dehydrogenase (short-subunit alcohol dehydrogenase family)
MGLHELLSLKDKIALVTGASRGLGKGFAAALAEAGAHLSIVSRHRNELTDTAEQVKGYGREVLSLQADITREDEVREMVERRNIPPEETSLESWSFVIDTNLNGPFLCAREVGKVMIPRKRGKIINIASMSGMIINRYFHGGSYDVSKSAVVGLTKALAVEWAKHNVNVIAVAPGYYGTAPNQKWFEANPEIRQRVIDMIPLNRLGKIEELAALVTVLASDVSNYMTGSTVVIDGGYTLW